jgi:hypothetical protein
MKPIRIIDISNFRNTDAEEIEAMRKEVAQRFIDNLVWRWIHDTEKFRRD